MTRHSYVIEQSNLIRDVFVVYLCIRNVSSEKGKGSKDVVIILCSRIIERLACLPLLHIYYHLAELTGDKSATGLVLSHLIFLFYFWPVRLSADEHFHLG